MNLQIYIQRTPNPMSLKFIMNAEVIRDGKAVFSSTEECGDIALARDIFSLPNVSQIYFFDNMITVTQTTEEWDELQLQVKSVILTRMSTHNADFKQPGKEPIKKENLSEELQKIEEVLDNTIRPGLKSDGGDLEVLKYEGNYLIVRYQGACGTCPSSMSGTLYAIQDILRREFNPEIVVIPD